MARRMEIELTSKREDGTWTWRAAGAREPRGTLDGALVPPATQVGDVVRVEVEGFLDGISVVSVVPPKAPRSEPERIDLLTPRSEGPLVTTRLARSSRRERPRREDRGDRGDREHRRRGRTDRNDRGERGPRSDRDRDRDRERGGERGGRGDRRERHPAPPPVEAKPKPKRLRPGKVHRSALLEALPAEQRPIAEQLLQGGIPAVRQAIEKQNDELKAAGKPQVAADPLIEIAERLRHRAQAAAWRDRADAALAQVDDLDLRDLRSVVNAADDGGRDEAARDVAAQLRESLVERVEKEQVAWVEEVGDNLRDGRVVRALRLSSRPPKAGSPLPPDISAQLIAATAAALTADTGSQRWATILDALAFSPIRRRVVPESLPDKLSAELRTTIARLGTRLPEIAHIFDITPEEAPARPPRQGGRGKGKGGGAGGGGGGDQGGEGRSRSRNKRRGDKPPKPDTKPTASPTTDAPPADAEPTAETTPADATATTESGLAEASVADPAPADATATDQPGSAEPAAADTAPADTTATSDPAPDTTAAETAAEASTADTAPADATATSEPAPDTTAAETAEASAAPAPGAATATSEPAAAEVTPADAPSEPAEAPAAEPAGVEVAPTEPAADETVAANAAGVEAAAEASPEASTDTTAVGDHADGEALTAEAPAAEAEEGANGTAEANGDRTAEPDADDEGVRIDS